MRSILRSVIFAVAVSGAAGTALADTPRHVDATPDQSFDEYVPGAARVEGRLLAPCCWDTSRQTLDIHGSPIANELRREIPHRIRAGERPDDIEADLVRRYTTKILAVPPDSPLPRVGTFLTLAVIGAGALAARMLLRWKRQGQASRVLQPKTASGAPADEWDARLDAALEDDDD